MFSSFMMKLSLIMTKFRNVNEKMIFTSCTLITHCHGYRAVKLSITCGYYDGKAVRNSLLNVCVCLGMCMGGVIRAFFLAIFRHPEFEYVHRAALLCTPCGEFPGLNI